MHHRRAICAVLVLAAVLAGCGYGETGDEGAHTLNWYNEPLNLFVAGFIGSPAMNFMPATVEGDRVTLPIGEVPLPSGVSGRPSGTLVAGVRPEDFEDASVMGGAARGTTFRARIEVLESMGSELYAHFAVTSDVALESDDLRELAADAGAGDVPSSREEGRIVARLDAASKVREGEEAELWVDAGKLHLFDSSDGRSLRASNGAPSAPE